PTRESFVLQVTRPQFDSAPGEFLWRILRSLVFTSPLPFFLLLGRRILDFGRYRTFRCAQHSSAPYPQPVKSRPPSQPPIRCLVVLLSQARSNQAEKAVLRRIHHHPDMPRPCNHVSRSRILHARKILVTGINIERTRIGISKSSSRVHSVHRV